MKEIEPVAWTDEENILMYTHGIEFQFPAHSMKHDGMVPLYAAPPQASALVAAAYRKAFEEVNRLHTGSTHPDAESWIANEILSLTPADAEKALDDMLMKVAREVMSETEYGRKHVSVDAIVDKVIAQF